MTVAMEVWIHNFVSNSFLQYLLKCKCVCFEQFLFCKCEKRPAMLSSYSRIMRGFEKSEIKPDNYAISSEDSVASETITSEDIIMAMMEDMVVVGMMGL